MSDRPLSLKLYGFVTGLMEPLAPWLLGRRAGQGKEDRLRLMERLGRSAAKRPKGALVWVHGASVGESLSHLPLVQRFARERPDVSLLVTSGTLTSAELLASRLPKRALHQYVPIDAPGAAVRFLERWRPDLAVFVESELWPNLLMAAKRRGVKLALLGARISEVTARAWDRAPSAADALVGVFDVVYAQNAYSDAWLRGHGAAVKGHLDLKSLAEPLPYDEAAMALLRAAVAGRPVVVTASTHAGEDAIVAEAFRPLLDRAPRPILILVPRHPKRGPEVAALLRQIGLGVALRSRDEPVTADTDVYIADTLGELGVFYRLADVAVMAGSFVEGIGGHNPLEPARLGVAVITGPWVANFQDTYDALLSEGAAEKVDSPAELTERIRACLDDPSLAKALGAKAEAAASRETLAFDGAWRALQFLLPAP